jgi:hypothetical protein
MSSVSNWSSAVCAVAIAAAPTRPATLVSHSRRSVRNPASPESPRRFIRAPQSQRADVSGTRSRSHSACTACASAIESGPRNP